MGRMIGKQSLLFDQPPYIIEGASVVGKTEKEGPLGKYFDITTEDPLLGTENFEAAESMLQKMAVDTLLKKTNKASKDIRYILAGDLLGQLTATTFGIGDFEIPFFGLYGACSTMGEAMSLGATIVDGHEVDCVIALASSHFASAEKQFRFPLAYGNQRPYSSTYTVTGSGAVLIGKEKGIARITAITTGKIVDYGIKDQSNMGACMAPAAANVIESHFMDFNTSPKDYDKIITGDLGLVGKTILIDLLKDRGYDIADEHMDCGVEMFDNCLQDTHAGGSGCGCAASVFSGYILDKLKRKEWKKILFVPTGALISPASHNEGNSIPGIAHLVRIEV